MHFFSLPRQNKKSGEITLLKGGKVREYKKNFKNQKRWGTQSMRREKRLLNKSKVLAKICGMLTLGSFQSIGFKGAFFRGMVLLQEENLVEVSLKTWKNLINGGLYLTNDIIMEYLFCTLSVLKWALNV